LAIIVVLAGSFIFPALNDDPDNPPTGNRDWTFGNALYFCITTLSTMGAFSEHDRSAPRVGADR